MASKSRDTGERTPTESAPATGDALTRSVSGNIIERHTLVEHPPAGESELDESRRQRIEIAAYYRAMNRGFAPGGEVDDWLEAERELSEQEGSGSVG